VVAPTICGSTFPVIFCMKMQDLEGAALWKSLWEIDGSGNARIEHL
jgi:hypothetical protein